ncbi:hypothetical protein RMR16_013560 [Agrobacterium sp. rho-13.3]|uniref:hypothetical protein n=1 Tax=Agrobacterium sp. rho-13.3 TaxID=3072980 RepID=UPI002A0CAF01|nr:hypothetical protein [Agrobacterium sp. rho-13.3]MDX8309908.1 hypothetical protein [Agrobacterium sp. rho-13.3]
MSHTPPSQEETCKLARSKDDRQNILVFPVDKASAARLSNSQSAQSAIATVKPAATNTAIAAGLVKKRYLHDAVNDTKSRLYSGPDVIASIAGVPLSQVNDAIRQVRFGASWPDLSYTPQIKWVLYSEIEKALYLLGYTGEWRWLRDQPTLAAYLKARTGKERDHPCVLSISNYYVAVSGGVFCDVSSRGIVVDIDDAEGRRKKVHRVFVVTTRIAPSPIASRKPVRKASPRGKLDQLFREAIKAETGAVRVKITPSEVFIIRHDGSGWYWLGSRDSVEDSILRPHSDHRLRGDTDEAASYRKAMGE